MVGSWRYVFSSRLLHGGILTKSSSVHHIQLARTAKPTSQDFVINVNAIQFEHLVLVGLRHVFEDVWQADVALDRR